MSISFDHPVVVTVRVKSSMCDLQIPTFGWVEEVNMRLLPPYPTSRHDVVDNTITPAIKSIGLVPYDSLAVMEDAIDYESHEAGIEEVLVKLLEGNDSWTYTRPGVLDKDTNLYEISVSIEPRKLGADIIALIEAKRAAHK